MNLQLAFNVALTVVLLLGGALGKVMWDTLTALRADMQTLSDSVNKDRQKAAETYQRRDDFNDAVHRLEASMKREFDQLRSDLATKANRSGS